MRRWRTAVVGERIGGGEAWGEQLGRMRARVAVGWGEMEEMEEVGSWELSGADILAGPMQRSVLCAWLADVTLATQRQERRLLNAHACTHK